MIISYIFQYNSDTGSASLFSCLDASIWHCRADTAQKNAVQKLHGIQMHLRGASVLSEINQLHGCSHSTSLKNSWNCTVPVRYTLLPPLPPASVTSFLLSVQQGLCSLFLILVKHPTWGPTVSLPPHLQQAHYRFPSPLSFLFPYGVYISSASYGRFPFQFKLGMSKTELISVSKYFSLLFF